MKRHDTIESLTAEKGNAPRTVWGDFGRRKGKHLLVSARIGVIVSRRLLGADFESKADAVLTASALRVVANVKGIYDKYKV